MYNKKKKKKKKKQTHTHTHTHTHDNITHDNITHERYIPFHARIVVSIDEHRLNDNEDLLYIRAHQIIELVQDTIDNLISCVCVCV